MAKRYNNNSVLVFADTHFPYHHDKIFDFLADAKRKHRPDRVVINGDLTDSYNFSQYSKDIGVDDVNKELKDLRKNVKKLIKIFPDVIITSSNHDARLWNKAKIAGIPKGILLPYNKLIGAEDANWKLLPDFTFTCDATRQQWFAMHHMAGSSLNAARGLGANVILSHQHTKQGVFRAQGLKHAFWAVDTGCLIDETKFSFAYQKLSQNKPVLGAVIIQEGVPKILPLSK